MGISMGGLGAGIWGLVLALLLSPPAQAEDDCIKRIFSRYCLGGEIDAVLRQRPQPLITQTDGERLALVYENGPDRIYVLGFRDRIYKVVRRYRGATQLRFDELYAVLRGKYGPGEDRSLFPAHANTPSRRLGSIRRGEGKAFHFWPASESWQVELTWTREMGIALAYVATDLNREQKALLDRGL